MSVGSNVFLTWFVRHDDLRRAFGRYGHILDVTIPTDYQSRRMKGFAFVEYPFP